MSISENYVFIHYNIHSAAAASFLCSLKIGRMQQTGISEKPELKFRSQVTQRCTFLSQHQQTRPLQRYPP